jgi:DNA-binding CsgD family transcriptional regulator
MARVAGENTALPALSIVGWFSRLPELRYAADNVVPPARHLALVVARLQAIEQSTDLYPALLPKVRLRTASGHWLVLHASRLSGPSAEAQIAVIFEVARPAEIAPLIVQAYDLSKRESEIMQSVLQGLSTVEIATTFQISSNTVQDHLKAIFEKVGVRSRRELVGQLFAQQYQPRLVSGRDVDANGWFT